jgi:hypothetical protein
MLLSNTAAMHCCHAWLASGVTSLLVTGRTRVGKILYLKTAWTCNGALGNQALFRYRSFFEACLVRGFFIWFGTVCDTLRGLFNKNPSWGARTVICPTQQALEIFELSVPVPSHTSSLCKKEPGGRSMRQSC